MLSVVITYFVI